MIFKADNEMRFQLCSVWTLCRSKRLPHASATLLFRSTSAIALVVFMATVGMAQVSGRALSSNSPEILDAVPESISVGGYRDWLSRLAASQHDRRLAFKKSAAATTTTTRAAPTSRCG